METARQLGNSGSKLGNYLPQGDEDMWNTTGGSRGPGEHTGNSAHDIIFNFDQLNDALERAITRQQDSRIGDSSVSIERKVWMGTGRSWRLVRLKTHRPKSSRSEQAEAISDEDYKYVAIYKD